LHSRKYAKTEVGIRSNWKDVGGKADTNGAPRCIANAVMDALAPLGIYHIDMPYTAPKLWAAVQAKRGKK
jgi:hypothetical protein